MLAVSSGDSGIDASVTSTSDADSGGATGDGSVAQPAPGVSATGGGPGGHQQAVSPTGNTIGQLQELCVRRGHPMPVYDLASVEGQPHQRSFAMKVHVGALEADGDGTSKKDAKREAAAKMINMLDTIKEVRQGRAKEEEDDGEEQEEEEDDDEEEEAVGEAAPETDAEKRKKRDEDEEDLVRKAHGLKIDSLTSKHSAQIQKFYKELTESPAPQRQLRQLHRTPLRKSARGADYVRMLRELGREHKFEVTFVDMEEDAEEGEAQCLVQLSTLPVAVCMGEGKDRAQAQQDAARTALVYLKTMTKKSVAAAANQELDSVNGGH